MLENPEPMTPAIFQVDLHQSSNNLDGMVQVVTLTSSHAKRFARRQFFKGDGWEIVNVTKIRDLKEEGSGTA